MKKFFLIVAIATLGLASCTDNKIDEMSNNDSNKIGFKTMIGKNHLQKATEMENATFTSFVINAYRLAGDFNPTALVGTNYFVGLTVSGTSGTDVDSWTYTGSYYWPTGTPADKLNFFAYANAPASGFTYTKPATGYPTIDYTPSTTVADQKDLLVACGLNKTSADATAGSGANRLSLTFNHILTQINFSLKGEDENLIFKVKEIKLTVVKPTGKYTYNNTTPLAVGNWVSSGTNTDYTYYTNTGHEIYGSTAISFGNGSGAAVTSPTAPAVAVTGTEALMLIPQALTDVRVVVKYDVYNNEAAAGATPAIGSIIVGDHTATASLNTSPAWEPNKKIRYTLTLPTNSKKIEFTASVTPWESETIVP